ncbi:alpha/beta hydrolase [Bradyrhizobium rifense]|uniref:Alpha/beta hydrolase n=1 Tax=Bradyrhizobium rifense TaxID=515499 RepID=A0A5D3KKT0_9BRAD|nr:alpha/beta fold hydrolase [Bradyrhizobium rifense]TYL96673.1 alpha/beta hydrolase [Bradyrhizobium rifense]
MLRTVAAGGLVATAASGVTGAARAQSARKTFVLVSGTYCGGWIWRRVTDRLEQSGHKVFAPSLTGLAERSHLLSKDINLDTHIADVVNLVQWESLENVCLVAWSYAGFVGAGALESIGGRVSSIVWLDAFLPTDGQQCRTSRSRRFARPCSLLLKRARQALVRRSLG